MALILGIFVHCIPRSCTSSPCSLLFLNPGVYGLVQATVGVGTVLIWDFCVAFTRAGGGGGMRVLAYRGADVRGCTCTWDRVCVGGVFRCKCTRVLTCMGAGEGWLSWGLLYVDAGAPAWRVGGGGGGLGPGRSVAVRMPCPQCARSVKFSCRQILISLTPFPSLCYPLYQ